MSHFGALVVWSAGAAFLTISIFIKTSLEETITCIGFGIILLAASAVLEEIDKTQKHLDKLQQSMQPQPIPLRQENVSYE